MNLKPSENTKIYGIEDYLKELVGLYEQKKIPNKKKRVVKEASVNLISLIRLEENKRKAEVLISNEKLEVSNIKKNRMVFFIRRAY